MQYSNKNLLLVVKSLITISCAALLILWFSNHASIFLSVKKLNLLYAFIALAMAGLNYFIEALKWQKALQPIYTISLGQAIKGICIGIASSMLMPNRSGEFAGRMFVVPSAWRIQAAAYTIMSNMTQLAATILLGGIGIYFCHEKVEFKNILNSIAVPDLMDFTIWILIALLLAGIVIYLLFAFVKQKLLNWWNLIISVRITKGYPVHLLLLSMLRFGVFTIQFVLLLLAYTMPLPILELVAASAATFFLVTLIPSYALVELIARVGITSYVFSSLGGSGETAAAAALLLWLVNVALPSLAGLLFIWKIKSERP